jgi:hypothetical protein
VTTAGLREFFANLATYFAALSDDFEPSIGNKIFIITTPLVLSSTDSLCLL